MEYVISNGIIELTLSSLGGEMVSLVKDGKERLWQNDNGSWAGHAPILFPYAGWVEMVNKGVDAERVRHGFLRKSEFSYFGGSESSITLSFQSDGGIQGYPFPFLFLVTYALDGNKVLITYEIDNLGEEPLPFGIGAHESYALDGEVSDYEVVLPSSVELKSLKTGDCGKLSGASVPLGTIDRIDLASPLLDNASTIILGDVPFQEVELRRKGGQAVAKVSFGGFPHLLLWHPEGSKMICIEPWENLPDVIGKETLPFAEKEGIITLAPKEAKAFLHVIEYGESL